MNRIDWNEVRSALDANGFATGDGVLSPEACDRIANLYDQPGCFRSRIVMRRHAFGDGEYQYFAYPLPDLIQTVRETAYRELVPLANLWAERLGTGTRYPPEHADFIEHCHAEGQSRPTPLVLKYGPGGYNRLHQDLYGDLNFPIQMAVLLSDSADFTGGAFVLTEQRARMQSRAEVVTLARGDAVFFAVSQRPVVSARGYSRATMRHGVSTIGSGLRMTLGVIFHDAR